MIRSVDFCRGIAVGLGIMYVMDPDLGRARRSRIPGLLLTGIVGVAAVAALALGSARIVARIRSDRLDEIEDDMPEYAMVR